MADTVIGSLKIIIGADTGDLDMASAKVQKFGKDMRELGRNLRNYVSLPIIAFGALSLKASGDFEAAMNKVRAVSGSTGKELDLLEIKAKSLGATTQFSASQAADAMSFLAMAGFNANQILGAIPGTLQLAASAQLDLGRAADIVSNVLTGYGKDVSELAHVNDVLVKAFTSANTNLEQLGEAMKYAGPVASQAGVDFEEAAAAISLMGNAGIQGTMAGTSLRGAISRIVNPTKQVREAMNEAGLSFTDAAGRLLPLDDIIEALGPHASDTGLFMQLFGQRAGPGMAALVSQGVDALRDLTLGLKESGGTAENIAAVQMEGFNGALKELKSALEAVMLAIGDSGLLEFMTDFAKGTAEALRELSEANPEMLRMGTIIAGVAAIAGPLIIILGALAGAIAAVGAPVALAVAGLAALAAVGIAVASGMGTAKDATIDYRDIAKQLEGVNEKVTASSGDMSEALKVEAGEKLNAAAAALELARADREATLAYMEGLRARGEQANAINTLYADGQGAGNSEIEAMVADELVGAENALNEIDTAIEQINLRREELARSIVSYVPTKPGAGEGEGEGDSEGDSGGGASSTDDYKAVISAANDRIAQLEVEGQALGKTAEQAAILRAQHELMVAAQQAGVEMSPEVIAQLEALGVTIGTAEARQTSLNEAMAYYQSLVQGSKDPITTLQDEMKKLNDLVQSGAINWDQYGQAAAMANSKAAGHALSMAGQVTGALASIFQESKGLAIAEVIINTSAAVMKSLAQYGYTPMGIAASVAAAATGAAQLAGIMSTTPNGGGSVASAPSGSVASEASSDEGSGNQTMHISGIDPQSLYSGDAMRSFVERLIEFQEDGGKVLFE